MGLYLTVSIKIRRVERSGHLSRNHSLHQEWNPEDVHTGVDEYLNRCCIGEGVVGTLYPFI